MPGPPCAPRQDLRGQLLLQPPPVPTLVEPGRACRNLSGPIITHAVISPFKAEKQKNSLKKNKSDKQLKNWR